MGILSPFLSLGPPARLRRVVALSAVAVGAMLCCSAPALADLSTPVLIVKGYHAPLHGDNCAGIKSVEYGTENEGSPGTLKTHLLQMGFTNVKTVSEADPEDENCDVNLWEEEKKYPNLYPRDFPGTGPAVVCGTGCTFQDAAFILNLYIYQNYTSKGITVDLVGYSTGGLIAAEAIHLGNEGANAQMAQVEELLPGYHEIIEPSEYKKLHPLKVAIGVTADGELNGTSYGERCFYAPPFVEDRLSCSFRTSAEALKQFHLDRNPQGTGGTEWYSPKSTGDTLVPEESAFYLNVPGCRKWKIENGPTHEKLLGPAQPGEILQTIGEMMQGPPICLENRDYRGYIVQRLHDTEPKAAYLVGGNGVRYLIRSSEVYYCLKYHGAPGPEPLAAGQIERYPFSGQFASCNAGWRPSPDWALEDEGLGPSQPLTRLTSANGQYYAEVIGGNLEVHIASNGYVVWQSGTGGHPGAYLVMQADGNLVIYTASGSPIWATGTNGHAPAYLALQDNGNLGVYHNVFGEQGDYGPVLWTAFKGANSQISVLFGKCLDVENGAVANHGNGTPVHTWECHGGENQQWTFMSDGTIRALGRCLDIDGANFQPGTGIEVNGCNNTWGAQTFFQSPNGAIHSTTAPSLCLNVAYGYEGNGGNVILWNCPAENTTGPNDGWFVSRVASGFAGKCLDVGGWHFTASNPVGIWDCFGGAEQEFEFTTGKQTGFGYGQIRTHENMCVDVYGGNLSSGEQPIALWPCNSGDRAQFFYTAADGSIRLSYNSGMCLDVYGAINQNGQRVQTYPCHGGPNQTWIPPGGTPANIYCSGPNCYTGGNYFTKGQCTYGAQVEFAQYLWQTTGTEKFINVHGNADEWAEEAERAGWHTTETPTANSIVVFQPGVDEANELFGHVAWVNVVNSDGTINITEMNNINNPGGWWSRSHLKVETQPYLIEGHQRRAMTFIPAG
jgi:surface antigen